MNKDLPFPEINIQFLKRNLTMIAGFFILLLLLSGARSMIFNVEPEGRAVIRRFGKVVTIKEPGLHFKLPFGIDVATFVPTERVLKQEFGFRSVLSTSRTQSSL